MEVATDQLQRSVREKNRSVDGEISLWLDEYDDIFSDFDSRPYSSRNLSEDFVDELKHIVEDDVPAKTISLLVPARARDTQKESLIHRRLHNHFKEMYQYAMSTSRGVRIRAIWFICAAAVLMAFAAYVSSLNSGSIALHVFLVIIEPAGWFLMWTGLDNLINRSGQIMSELRFYKKLAKSKVRFSSL
jgi:hypothetical protein